MLVSLQLAFTLWLSTLTLAFPSLLTVGDETHREKGFLVVREFDGDVACPSGAELRDGSCRELLKQAPEHWCPPEYFFADGFCHEARKPQLECPVNFVLVGSGYCERSISLPCEMACPSGSLPALKGSQLGPSMCLMERPVEKTLMCTEGVLDRSTRMCVIETVLKPDVTCASDQAVLEGGACITVEIMRECNEDAPANDQDTLTPRTCLSLRADASRVSCKPGFAMSPDQRTCVKRDSRPPIGLCRHTSLEGRCVDTEYVHPHQTCAANFSKKSIFGLCSCSRSEAVEPKIVCPAGSEYKSELEHCMSRTAVKFACPHNYKIRGTICERLVESSPVRTFNVTLKCSTVRGSLDCDV